MLYTAMILHVSADSWPQKLTFDITGCGMTWSYILGDDFNHEGCGHYLRVGALLRAPKDAPLNLRPLCIRPTKGARPPITAHMVSKCNRLLGAFRVPAEGSAF